jgi:amidase
MAYWCAHLAVGIDTIAQMTGKSPSRDNFEGMTFGLYQSGKAVSAVQYLMAKGALQMAAREAARFHQTYDIWLTPVLGRPPVPLGSFNFEETDPIKAFAPMIDYVPFTAMQNATGQPAINVPLHWNGNGLPIGTQFVGRFGEEELLLRLARQLEQAQPWAQRYPAIEL